MSVSNVWGICMTPAASLPRLRQPRFCSCDSPSNNSNYGSNSSHWSFALHKSSHHRRRSHLNHSCRCSGDRGNTISDWDWNRWSRHFSEIEQTESLASVLKFQLEDAIEKEEFQDAAKLKLAIEEATSKDCVAEIMSELKNAIEEERYHDALRLCKNTASGLVGWWVGCSKDSDDPFGRLVRITPGMGKFIGRSYTPRQLLTAARGTPLFEIYVIKDAGGAYNMKVVYLKRAKTSSLAKSAMLVPKSAKGLSTSQTEDPKGSTSLTDDPLVSSSQPEDQSAADIQVNKDKADKTEEKSLNIEGATEEGIRSVLKFLKDKIPGLKVKVVNVDVSNEAIEDIDSVKQLMQEDDEKQGSVEKSDNEANNSNKVQPDTVAFEGDTDTLDDGKDSDTGLFIGGVLHKEDTPTKDEYVRLPAEVTDIEKDSFVLHIPQRSHDKDTEGSKVSKLNVATVAAQVISELMPSDVAKTFWSADKISSKVTRDVREIVKLAVSQAQKRNELSDYTNFSRVSTSGGDLDPFDGLYVGAFGPYGTEVVQLRRKFGYWNGSDDAESATGVEFFEYVEAVKLTGDLNVPAGQVTFRAKIGKGNRASNRGLYPDELGVVSSYKGQGRIAEFGFQNPRWVEGELLQLSGRGMGPYVRGAELGFLYVVPEQSFLVLFNRLKLPD